jgi:hypothetical protein
MGWGQWVGRKQDSEAGKENDPNILHVAGMGYTKRRAHHRAWECGSVVDTKLLHHTHKG